MEKCVCEKCKTRPRTAEEKSKLVGRLNRIAGQINGVKNMIETDRYCDDVLIQLSAIDKAVKSISTLILEEHMRTCIVDQLKEGKTEVVDEIVELFRRFQ